MRTKAFLKSVLSFVLIIGQRVEKLRLPDPATTGVERRASVVVSDRLLASGYHGGILHREDGNQARISGNHHPNRPSRPPAPAPTTPTQQAFEILPHGDQ